MNLFEKTVKYVHFVLARVAFIALLAMMFSTVINVISRNLFNSPIPGSVELIRNLMVVLVFLSLSFTQLEKAHIRVNFFIDKLKHKTRNYLIGMQYVISIITFTFLFIGATLQAYTSTLAGEYDIGLLKFPVWPGRIAIAIGVLFLVLQYIIDAKNSFTLNKEHD